MEDACARNASTILDVVGATRAERMGNNLSEELPLPGRLMRSVHTRPPSEPGIHGAMVDTVSMQFLPLWALARPSAETQTAVASCM